MKNNGWIKQLGALAALISTALALTGCKSDPEDPNCGGNSSSLRICLGNPDTSSPPPPPPPVPGSSGGNSVMPVFTDYEPNNTLLNANQVSFGSGPGLRINGSVTGDTDPADFFVFSPHRTDRYSVYLCADICTRFLQTDSVYIMIYDQSHTTIASTPVGTVSEQVLSVDLAEGLAYYVEVNGYNTGVNMFDYAMIITD